MFIERLSVGATGPGQVAVGVEKMHMTCSVSVLDESSARPVHLRPIGNGTAGSAALLLQWYGRGIIVLGLS
jgi:hypothetical protein